MRLAIAIPTYNEAANVKKLLPAIKKNLEGQNVACTVFVVDDSSPDGTASTAQDLAKKLKSKSFEVKVISRTKKEGLGKAYIFAFHKILGQGFDFILQMDADLSHNPKYLPVFISKSKSAELVVGSRYIKGGSTPDWQWHRKLLSRAGNLYTRALLGSKITDYTGGYNMFSDRLLKAIDLDGLDSGGYGFLIDLKYNAIKKARGVDQVPIVFMDRTHGESKLPNGIIIKNLRLVVHLKYFSKAMKD